MQLVPPPGEEPESFTRADLAAWLNGPTWTDPASGTPDGPIESLSVSLMPDHTVRVSPERNG